MLPTCYFIIFEVLDAAREESIGIRFEDVGQTHSKPQLRGANYYIGGAFVVESFLPCLVVF